MDRRGTSVVLTFVPTPRPLAGGPGALCRSPERPPGGDAPGGPADRRRRPSRRVVGNRLVRSVRAGTGARDSVNFVSWSFAALFAVVFFARLTIGTRKIEPAYVAVLHGRQRRSSMPGTSRSIWASWCSVRRWITGPRSGWCASPPPREAAAGAGAVARHQSRPARVLQVRQLPDAGRRGMSSARPRWSGCRRSSWWRCRWASASTPSSRCPTPSTSTAACWRRSGTSGPFFLFISFFPQLVAGPIVRAVEFLPQMPRPRRLRASACSTRACGSSSPASS